MDIPNIEQIRAVAKALGKGDKCVVGDIEVTKREVFSYQFYHQDGRPANMCHWDVTGIRQLLEETKLLYHPKLRIVSSVDEVIASICADPTKPWQVDDEYAKTVNIDDINNPLLFINIDSEMANAQLNGEELHLMIDGNHRLRKAQMLGIKTLQFCFVPPPLEKLFRLSEETIAVHAV